MNRSQILAGAATVTLVAFLGSVAAPPAAASPRWSDWSAPTSLGETINAPSPVVDFGPGVSKDGLALYFTSRRTGGLGGEDIWVSYRATPESAWGTPLNLTPVNSTTDDRVPAFSRDGHWMFFARGLPPDIWSSYRPHTHEDFGPFGWQPPTPVTSLNTAFADVAPAYFRDDETGTVYLFFASNRPRPGVDGLDFDIYVATQQPDGSFGPASNVTELNSPVQDARPAIRHDGLEIIFHSLRAGEGGFDLWSATRESVGSAWSSPVNLATINTAHDEVQPAISADGRTLYFAFAIPGVRAPDLWMSTRTKESGKP